MPETPKEKKDGTWEEDQKEHEYYYDDAHGYEDYNPEIEAETEDDQDEDEQSNATSQ